MSFWLMKTEPTTFGIDDLARLKREHWDGVRNYQARNNMMSMKLGDRVLIYHSNTEPIGVAGIGSVVREAYPDHTAQDPSSPYFDPKASSDKPIWHMVDIAFEEKLPRIVSLRELKTVPGLSRMAVVQKGSRLSVTPVTQEEFEIVCALAHSRPG